MSGKKRGGGPGRPSSSSKAKQDFERGSWECSVCTFRNRYESFKCEMCDTRKGTSTRKPRLNQNVVHQQTLVQNLAMQQSQAEQKAIRRKRASSVARGCTPESESSSSMVASSPAKQSKAMSTLSKRATSVVPSPSTPTSENSATMKPLPTLNDDLIDRSSAKKTSISISGKTIVFTEFKTARKRKST